MYGPPALLLCGGWIDKGSVTVRRALRHPVSIRPVMAQTSRRRQGHVCNLTEGAWRETGAVRWLAIFYRPGNAT